MDIRRSNFDRSPDVELPLEDISVVAVQQRTGFSQRVIAKKLGVTYGAISVWSRGAVPEEQVPRLHALVRGEDPGPPPPPKDRAPDVTLAQLVAEGLSVAQAASRLGVPSGQARARLHAFRVRVAREVPAYPPPTPTGKGRGPAASWYVGAVKALTGSRGAP